ncbi:hypothetical protein LL14B4_09945 [Lactococcus lactis subsp. lactis]|uniref:Uncharacterized protein n=1 Tax=Lactococcus lactis subsp. lactis TaxID=1360 RepID=A0A2Z3KG93_LACLL|nr:hypothetical protein [Lactococcus lactis]AWN66477.1 hypothetical protein LL14B4_09945 [Lactococcus lactis subsp. lactis]
MVNFKDWLKAHPEEALPKKDHWRMEIFETNPITLQQDEFFINFWASDDESALNKKLYEKFPNRNCWYHGLVTDFYSDKLCLYFAYLCEDGRILEILEQTQQYKNKDGVEVHRYSGYNMRITATPYQLNVDSIRVPFGLFPDQEMPKLINTMLEGYFQFERCLPKRQDINEDLIVQGSYENEEFVFHIANCCGGPGISCYDKKTKEQIYHSNGSGVSWKPYGDAYREGRILEFLLEGKKKMEDLFDRIKRGEIRSERHYYHKENIPESKN